MSQHKLPPLPEVPTHFTAPMSKVTVTPNGSADLPGYFPFYYAGIQSMWVWWQVELSVLDEMLAHGHTGLRAARFADGGDMGLVNINFFNAAALYGAGQPGNPGVGGFSETEVNIVAYPEAVQAAVPRSYTVKGFIRDGDQTKRMGNYRVWVACDNAVAVAAGRQRYFENKILVAYDYNVPNLNNDPAQVTWVWQCFDAPGQGSGGAPALIYSGEVDLTGLTPVPGNPSEWIDLSVDPQSKRPVASRRNYFGLHDTFFLADRPVSPVNMHYGPSANRMRHDLQRLVGSRPAFAIQRFVSPPVIAEASPYYADL